MSALASAFRRHPHSTTTDTPSRSRRMPSLFSTIRASIYGTVLVFTVICLGMAGHFQSVLAASDLTRFVPFAIFVCVASLFIFTVLLLFSVFLRERNPISTRIELASLGLAGVFWLVLGVYLTTSEAQDADVECFESTDSQVVLSDEIASFHTDQFQAMYRVLMSFALMNAALIIASCLTLLFLAYRRHRQGDIHMWHGPVTSGAWFNTYGNSKAAGGFSEKPRRKNTSDTVRSLLPTHAVAAGAAAITAAATRSKSTTRTPPTAYTEKPERKASGRRGTGDPQRQNSGRSAIQPTRQNSSRSQIAAVQPTRQDSGRSEPRRQNSGRDPQRSNSTRDPQRSNSARDPQRSNSAREPHRSNSGREPQRTNSGREQPHRQNSSGTRQQREQSSRANPYMAHYYNSPLPPAPAQTRYPSSGTSAEEYDAGHMVNPARQNSRRR